jgi:hypothetical protein
MPPTELEDYALHALLHFFAGGLGFLYGKRMLPYAEVLSPVEVVA